MPKSSWMAVQTPENFAVSQGLGFTVHGLSFHHRRRAQRMEPDDLMLFYISGIRKWAAIATITSRYFEDREPIWKSEGRGEVLPYRVKLTPSIVLDEDDYVDALVLGPRLEYVKRWVPEMWPLAFMGALHLLPQRDFRLIEGEIKRALGWRREKRRERWSRAQDGDTNASEEAGPQEKEVSGGEPESVAEGSG